MATKHFIINPEKENFDRGVLAQSQLEEIYIHKQAKTAKDEANERAMVRAETLRYVPNRVIIKINVELKNSHRFEDGTVIRRERKYNQFNMRIAQPVNAVVVSGENVPEGVEVLINHNSIHDTNKIFDYPKLSGAAEATDIRYYSIPEEDCFAWRDKDGVVKPMKNFEFGLRVYKPYLGSLEGVEHELVKDVLYVTTGKLKGKVVNVLKASDYQIVFQGLSGREENVIRFRHSDEQELDREEVVCIEHTLSKKVKSGELFVGLTPQDAKSIDK